MPLPLPDRNGFVKVIIAKTFLGKAWHWNHRNLEKLGENIWRRRRKSSVPLSVMAGLVPAMAALIDLVI
jgi:hypothetical protein